jgi:hypothetical protein
MRDMDQGFRHHSVFYVSGKLGVSVAYHAGVFFDS